MCFQTILRKNCSLAFVVMGEGSPDGGDENDQESIKTLNKCALLIGFFTG
jgi:hypothetical protein